MTDYQKSLLKMHEFIFCLSDDGLWRCINQKYSGTPADLCGEFGIAVPDCTQFLRCLIEWLSIGLEYRAYGGRIRIDIYPRS